MTSNSYYSTKFLTRQLLLVAMMWLSEYVFGSSLTFLEILKKWIPKKATSPLQELERVAHRALKIFDKIFNTNIFQN